MTERQLFDADALRGLVGRTIWFRAVEHPTLVLGSTQPAGVVDPAVAARLGVEVVRRRSGGGAVLVEPGRAVWVDTWIPRSDPLFDDDIGRSRSWVGEWWAEALGGESAVHEGSPTCTPWSELVCFGGIAAGEVSLGGRKLVGVAQWRSREGALTHSLAYGAVDWTVLTLLLGLGGGAAAAATELSLATTTLSELGQDPGGVAHRLMERLPEPDSWALESA